MSNWIFDALEWAHNHGVWEIIIIVGGLSIWAKLFPRRRIRNLNLYMRPVRQDAQAQFPLVIYLGIRNYTGRTVVLSNPFIRFDRDLRAPPEAHGDSPSGDIEIKFPDQNREVYSEVEFLLRNKDNVNTIIPLDPTHSDAEVQTALNRKRLGRLTVTCTWIQEKPQIETYGPRL
jgi:hypothetical protein